MRNETEISRWGLYLHWNISDKSTTTYETKWQSNTHKCINETNKQHLLLALGCSRQDSNRRCWSRHTSWVWGILYHIYPHRKKRTNSKSTSGSQVSSFIFMISEIFFWPLCYNSRELQIPDAAWHIGLLLLLKSTGLLGCTWSHVTLSHSIYILCISIEYCT